MTTDANPPAIFAHAMWRSGSTYLASRFARSDRYLLFYEPFHEGVGRPPSRARTRDRNRLQDRKLKHPDIGAGYFDSYELEDPQTGRKLTDLYAFSSSLRDVYDVASDRTVAYLSACSRVAQARGRAAFLGFCNSGTQHERAFARIGGTSLHLWRAPREQFRSYNWPENDYFVPGTILQLLLSRRYRRLALSLAEGRIPPALLMLVDLLPDRRARMRYRIGRRIAARLTIAQCYALFYLSWRISHDSARQGALFSFSLTGLAEDGQLRTRMEERFAISFADLRPTPADQADGIAYDEIEAAVDIALAQASAQFDRRIPSSAVDCPPALFTSS